MPSAPRRHTRARTRPGRLRLLDAWLLEKERPLLLADPPEAPVVDVGFGLSPATTLELSAAVQSVRAGLSVVGIEQDEGAVLAARADAAAAPALSFLQGDFDTLRTLSPAPRLVRAVNLLRQYRPEEVSPAREALGGPLRDGGLLLEGSTDTPGDVGSVWLLRKTSGALVPEGLLFFTDFTRGFAPRMFRDWLPRELRWKVQPGSGLHRFFADWQQALEDTRPHPQTPALRFAASAERLVHARPDVQADAWMRTRGYLLWTGAPG